MKFMPATLVLIFQVSITIDQGIIAINNQTCLIIAKIHGLKFHLTQCNIEIGLPYIRDYLDSSGLFSSVRGNVRGFKNIQCLRFF